eukprot:266293-Hanusia_phi.AAC.1
MAVTGGRGPAAKPARRAAAGSLFKGDSEARLRASGGTVTPSASVIIGSDSHGYCLMIMGTRRSLYYRRYYPRPGVPPPPGRPNLAVRSREGPARLYRTAWQGLALVPRPR